MVQNLIEYRGNTWYVSGGIDVHTDLKQILKTSDAVLRINFGSLESITSIGSRNLRELLAARGQGRTELHECPPFLVDLCNSVRLIDRPEFNAIVMSVVAPFDCPACGTKGMGVLVPIKDVKLEKGQITSPSKACQACRGKMTLSVDEHEFFFLITSLFKDKAAAKT